MQLGDKARDRSLIHYSAMMFPPSSHTTSNWRYFDRTNPACVQSYNNFSNSILKSQTHQQSDHSFTMAEAFLSHLPRVGRGILGNENQCCSICMEDYGTTESLTGIIERPVKLPCNHIMGSECISIWVSAPSTGGSGNNTCPICRHVLFQAPSLPTSPPRAEHTRIHTVLTNRCMSISAQLDFPSPNIYRLARWIANCYHDIVRLEDHELGDGLAHALAAASVCMASHLLRSPRSLELISSCVDVGEDAIRSAYGLLHSYRHELVDAQELARVGLELDGIDGVLPSVPP